MNCEGPLRSIGELSRSFGNRVSQNIGEKSLIALHKARFDERRVIVHWRSLLLSSAPELSSLSEDRSGKTEILSDLILAFIREVISGRELTLSSILKSLSSLQIKLSRALSLFCEDQHFTLSGVLCVLCNLDHPTSQEEVLRLSLNGIAELTASEERERG
jgi:hypothetical protein